MLPAPELTEIIANLGALNLQPNTAAQILAAVLAPLLRSSDRPALRVARRRAGQPRRRPRKAVRRSRGSARKRKYTRHAPTEARERAIAALRANPDATPTEIAKVAKVSRPTVVNARRDLAKEARKQARKAARKGTRETSKPPPDRRERAQRFLQDQLARGPKRATDVEEAASKAHVDPQALEQARTALGIVASRSNAGVQAVQWSLPA
jgi:DNA-binding CsgD family transcriptional regulator